MHTHWNRNLRPRPKTRRYLTTQAKPTTNNQKLLANAATTPDNYPTSKLTLGSHKRVQMQIKPEIYNHKNTQLRRHVDHQCVCKPHFA